MKKFLFEISFVMVVAVIITSCTLNNKSNKNLSENLSKVLTYKDSNAGDSSAISGILKNLPGNVYLEGFELKTFSEPYGIVAKYKYTNKQIEMNFQNSDIKVTNLENILKDNSTIIFALVKNLDYVEYKLDNGETKKYTRDKALEYYGKTYGENLQGIVENQRSLESFLK